MDDVVVDEGDVGWGADNVKDSQQPSDTRAGKQPGRAARLIDCVTLVDDGGPWTRFVVCRLQKRCRKIVKEGREGKVEVVVVVGGGQGE